MSLSSADQIEPSPPTTHELVTGLQKLPASAGPAVVFTALAELFTKSFADNCQVQLRVGQDDHQIWAPSIATEPSRPPLPITFAAAGYSGLVALSWRDQRRPADADAVIAQLLVNGAVELISRASLQAQVAGQADRIDNLIEALESNREIGKAIGILMASRKVTSAHAFDLLRAASQHSHRKIRQVAIMVADTGTLELPPDRPG